MRPLRETLKEAGYINIKPSLFKGEYILTDTEGKMEIWLANKYHPSYGIKYRNTVLEFARSI